METTAQSFTQAERQAYIGASEFAACMGIDQYRSRLDVYNTKMGLSAPFLGNYHTERGNRLERVAAEIYTSETGKALRRRTEAFTHPEWPFLKGHVDRIVVGEKKIAEIKCPSVAAYRRMQRYGLPETYIVQMNGYLGLSGYPVGEFIVFCADMMDVTPFEVEFDQTIYDAAVQSAVSLWQENITLGISPAADSTDKPAIEFTKIGGNLTIREDPAWVDAAGIMREAMQLERDATELKEMARTRIKEVIENEYGRYEGAGLRLYFSQQAGRKTLDKKALAAAHPEIDLGKFEKQGEPFEVLRPYLVGE